LAPIIRACTEVYPSMRSDKFASRPSQKEKDASPGKAWSMTNFSLFYYWYLSYLQALSRQNRITAFLRTLL